MHTRRRSLFDNAMRNANVARNSYLYGWPVDPDRQRQIAGELDERIAQTLSSIREQCREVGYEAWESINPGSGKQLSHLFYNVLAQPLQRRTASGAPGTGKDSLQEIVDRGDPHAAPLAGEILAHKQARKLKEAYVTKMAGITLVRPQAHVTAQLSGRWSYRDPALQTTPAKIKPMFVAHPGCYMVACDLSQAELRNIAQLSGDEGMMQAYRNGEDIHAATAMAAFGCTLEEAKTRPRRLPAKIIGLGYNYSVLDDTKAAVGLHMQLVSKVPGITLESVMGIIARLREQRAGVRAYKERLWQQAQDLDYVEEPISGRRRKFYGRAVSTEVYNFPCQSLTSKIVDTALQGLDAEFLPEYHEGLLLNRHDEAVIGGKNLHRLMDMLWRHLRQEITVNNNRMMYDIEYQIGTRWGEGMATIEPEAPFAPSSPEDVTFKCIWGKERDTVKSLTDTVRWIEKRIKPYGG